MKWVILLVMLLGCSTTKQPVVKSFMGVTVNRTATVVFSTAKLTQYVLSMQQQIDSLITVAIIQQLEIDSLKKGVVLLDTAHIFKIDSVGNVTLRDSLILHGVLSVTGAIYLAPDSAHMVYRDTIINHPPDSIPIYPVDSTHGPIVDTLYKPTVPIDPEGWDIKAKTIKKKSTKKVNKH